MKKVLRWTGFGLLGVLGLIVTTAGVLLFLGNRKLTRAYGAAETSFALQETPTLVPRGEHLVRNVSQCVGCHGSDLGGAKMIDEPGFATIYAPNLTTGEGGAALTFEPADWDRALRYGISSESHALAPMMPSEAAQNLSDADLSAIVAYLKSVPPIDRVTPPPHYGLMAKMLVGAGVFPLAPDLVAETPRLESIPQEGNSADYGAYLVHIAGCTVCHGTTLAGAEDPAEAGVMTPNLIASAAGWSTAEFERALRTGQTPQGKALDPEAMPWPGYAEMTDTELTAIHRYLDSLR